MDKIEKGNPLTQSADIVKENLETLKRLFPTIVKEGKIDVDELKALIDDEVETSEEYYRFTWAGKSEARREANKPSTGTLRPNKADSKDWDTTGNIFIEGDNLEVLKLMQKSYAGKIKMIYIDPPYNTGKDFVYKDNYADNLGNYLAMSKQTDDDGNILSTNTESDGRYHSNWLNMMYPRLKLARNLLKDDGVIFISIGDNELSNLVLLCNEVFGENNLISVLVWNCSTAGGIRPKHFSKTHEYCLLYATDIKKISQINAPLSSSALSMYTKKDDKDYYREKDFVFKNTSTNINQKYEITCPDGEVVIPKDGYIYRFIEETFRKALDENLVVFKKTNTGPLIQPSGKQSNWNIYIKKYLGDGTGAPSTLLSTKEIGFYNNGTALVQNIFDNVRVFENSKPVDYLKYLFNLFEIDNEYVLDFFAGSASTAHALFELNAVDGQTRKFICIQIPEPNDEKKEAFKAGYKNIAEISKERIRRAGEKVKSEVNTDLFSGDTKGLDIGFKAFKLDSSNIHSWDGSIENFEANLFNAQNNIKDDRTEEDVLFEILLKYGLDLTVPIEQKAVGKCKVYSIGAGVLFICLSDNITTEVAKAIGEWKNELEPATCRVLFKDNGFIDDVAKTNSVQILRQYGIEECNSI